MVSSTPVRDRKLPGHAVTSAARTLAKTMGAQAGPRELRKARPSVLPIQAAGTAVRAGPAALCFR